MRDTMVKLLIAVILSANLSWATEQGAELFRVCVPDAVAHSVDGQQNQHHPSPTNDAHHCCHASVHFTGLPDTSAAMLADQPVSEPEVTIALWQTRVIQPRLRPPKA